MIDDIFHVLDRLQSLETPPSHIAVALAPERKSLVKDFRTPPLHLQLHSRCRIAALNTQSGEGLSTTEYAAVIDAQTPSFTPQQVATAVSRAHNTTAPAPVSRDDDLEFSSLIPLDDDPTPLSVHRLQTSHMTDEERGLKRFTRKNLQKLSNWPV